MYIKIYIQIHTHTQIRPICMYTYAYKHFATRSPCLVRSSDVFLSVSRVSEWTCKSGSPTAHSWCGQASSCRLARASGCAWLLAYSDCLQCYWCITEPWNWSGKHRARDSPLLQFWIAMFPLVTPLCLRGERLSYKSGFRSPPKSSPSKLLFTQYRNNGTRITSL